MNLSPKRTKFRKSQKGSMRGMSKSRHFIEFGTMGIQSLERGYISNKQLESVRIVISKNLNREGKALFRVYPEKPLTAKPIQTRMGKGKGAVKSWVAVVRPGTVILEVVGNNNKEKIREALRKAACKLSVKTRCVESVEVV